MHFPKDIDLSDIKQHQIKIVETLLNQSSQK